MVRTYVLGAVMAVAVPFVAASPAAAQRPVIERRTGTPCSRNHHLLLDDHLQAWPTAR